MAEASGSYYPPVGFYFQVKFAGFRSPYDAAFQDVGGLVAERSVQEIEEGGENRFTHRLPGRARYRNLVLKRGLMVLNSDLATWCRTAMTSDLAKVIKPHDLDVVLLDAEAKPLMTWSVVGAWPVKWGVSDFNSMANQIVVETLEFAYTYFRAS